MTFPIDRPLRSIPVPCMALSCILLFAVLGCSTKSDDAKKTSTGSSATAAQGAPDKTSSGGAQSSDTVNIPREDQQRVGIQVAPVVVQSIPRTLTVAGQVQLNEKQTTHIGTLADGRITAVNVLPGAVVHRGQILGQLHSHLVHETVGALVQAYAAVDRQKGAILFAHQAQDRYHHLYAIQAASLEESQRADQQVLEAEKMQRDAEANLNMERQHLSELLQVSPESLTPANLYNKELVPIRSPMDGVVIARNITVGQVVDTGFEAFVVSNLSTVWVTASVNQKDLSLVRIGATAQLDVQGYPDQLFRGRVGMIGDMLDPQTRTIPVRIVVPNPDTRLRPGMFATARLAEPSTRVAVFVPEDALQEINGLQVVFITYDNITFQAKTVTPGAHSMGQVEIVEGLTPKDRVVIHGAFIVKSEMLKGTMGEG